MQPHTLTLAASTVDLARGDVRRFDGSSAKLTTHEQALLTYLAARPGRDVSRDELLREVWGYRAATHTRAVDDTMKRLRKKVEDRPAQPFHLLTVHGTGYRFQALEPRRAPLDLFGRRADRAAIDAAFAEGARLVVVTGPGGIGKTALARSFFPELAGVADLSPSGTVDDDDVVVALAVALGQPAHTRIERIAAMLASSGRALLVDDADRAASAVCNVLRIALATPGTRFLVTSREPLGVPGERIIELGPLGKEHALALFVARAAAASGYEAVASADLDALMDQLHGHPLSIELAAGRTTVMDARALVKRLHDRFDVLRRPGDPGRGGLWASIAGSVDRCSASEQLLLADLAMFPTSFDLVLAEAVATPTAESVADRLSELLRRSLVQSEVAVGGLAERRFRLLPSIRDFASELPVPEGRDERWCRAMAEHAASLTAVAFGPDAIRCATEYGRTVGSHRLAHALALRAHPDRAVDLALALYRLHRPTRWFSRMLADTLPVASGDNRARLLALKCAEHCDAGDLDSASRCASDALGAAVTPRGLGWARSYGGIVHFCAGEFSDARRELLAGVELLGDDDYMRALTYGVLVAVSQAEGDVVEAGRWVSGALEVAVRCADAVFEAETRLLAARLALHGGDVTTAAFHHDSASRLRALYPSLVDPAEDVVALIALERGDAGPALEAARLGVERVTRDLTQVGMASRMCMIAGWAAHRLSGPVGASVWYRRGLDGSHPEDRRFVPWLRASLAVSEAELGRFSAVTELVAIDLDTPAFRVVASVIRRYGETGDPVVARDLARESLLQPITSTNLNLRWILRLLAATHCHS